MVNGDWHGKQYLALKASAWKKLAAYYEANKYVPTDQRPPGMPGVNSPCPVPSGRGR